MNYPFSLMFKRLISDSNTHLGFRVLIAMACTFIPAIFDFSPDFLNQSNLQISTALCLGVMASAIVEVDESTKDRQKFIITVITCFFIAAASVELLMPYPILFAIGLGTSSFAFMMLSSLGTHYSRIGFGAILVAIYTMVGHHQGISWFEQPLLLAVGALWYGFFAITWSYISPNRTLREELAQLYFALSRYQLQKSALFDTQEGDSKEAIIETRQKLAILNISIVGRLASSRHLIREKYQGNTEQHELKILNQYYLIAEQIHERISASQYLYSQLEHTFGRSQILEGFHQLLLQIADECYTLGSSINDKKNYQHSKRLKWTINALSDQLYLLKEKLQLFQNNQEAMQALQAIYDNLSGIDNLLLSINVIEQESQAIIVDQEEPQEASFKEKIVAAYEQKTSVYKHAVRISISLVFAYALHLELQLENGFWILLTVLFVCQPSFSETRKRLIRRSFGTLLGIVISFPALYFIENDLINVSLMIFSAFLFFNYVRTNYGVAVIFITLFVMIVSDIQKNSGIDILSGRVLETLAGCLLSVIAISVIYPDWQFKRFPHLANNLLLNSSQYFKQICQQYQFGRSENLAFRKIRFAAFKADSEITAAWQSMLFEPSSKQKLKQEVYGLVNRCDALNCYIAALSSHRQKIESKKDLEIINPLFELTSQQILYTYRPELKENENTIDIDAFDFCNDELSNESKLIVRQLQLIAFSAIDIQLLLQEIKSKG